MRDPLAGIPVGGDALSERLAQQLRFCLEVDKVKQVLRLNLLSDGSRREGDAEHQWHLALMAIVLAEYAAEPVDISKVVMMALIHDLVEIDAGDVDAYDTAGRQAAKAREQAAAERIYGILPPDQGARLRAIWEEFEDGDTPEARFARSLDRLAPMILNAASDGKSWSDRNLTADQVTLLNSRIGVGAPDLWTVGRAVIDRAVADGVIAPQPEQETSP